jgi:hypothetical protein
MIEVRLYQHGDWEAIIDAVEPFSPPFPTEEFNQMIVHSLAATGLEGGRIMACGGITLTSDNNGLVWLKMSKQCGRNAYRWGRTIKETIICMKEALGITNIYTYIVDNFCKGDKLARMVGLRRTDEHEKYKGNKYYKYVVT